MSHPGAPRNQVGVASVLLGGAALATCWLLIGVPLGIAALLSGDIARRRVSRGEATNQRAATAGMVLGAVAIVAGLVAIGYYSWLDSQDPGRLQRCLDNPATNNC
jgi:Na+(H+)/acetate symporter ActP